MSEVKGERSKGERGEEKQKGEGGEKFDSTNSSFSALLQPLLNMYIKVLTKE